MTLRAVVFDLGDTLIRLRALPSFGPVVHQHLHKTGLAQEGLDAQSLLADLRTAAAALDAGREAVYESMLCDLMLDRGVAQPGAHARALARVFDLGDVERFEAPPGLSASMAQFRAAGFKLAIVSNTTTSPALLRAYLESVGITPHIDAAVFSVEHGYRKPSPSIYHAALDALGVAPSEALFTGDRVREDVAGPMSAGMRAALMHRFRQETPPGDLAAPVVRSLDELRVVVARLNSSSGE